MLINLVKVSFSSLGGNPLHCDCELQWLPEFLRSFEANAGTTVSAETCETPMAASGRSLDSLDPSQFICGKTVVRTHFTCTFALLLVCHWRIIMVVQSVSRFVSMGRATHFLVRVNVMLATQEKTAVEVRKCR